MAKRQLTPEQTEKRDARRAKFGALVKQIAAMSDAERDRLSAEMPCIVTVEGRTLSPSNMMLVYLQHANPTVVGGFNQWLKQGRCVRKGESGLMIWAPTSRKGDTASTPEPTTIEASDSPNFIMVTVFDISQTEAVSKESEAA